MVHPFTWEKLSASKKLPLTFVSGWRQPLNAGVCCPVHEHRAVEIVYHQSGEGITRLRDGKSLRFAEGSFVVYPPRLPHDQVMDRKGEDLCIHVSPPPGFRLGTACLLTGPAGRLLASDADFLTSRPNPLRALEQRILDLRATALLLAVLQLAGTQPEKKISQGEAQVQAVEAYILENYARIRSLREAVKVSGLSHDRLRHLFKEKRGLSLVSFLSRTRIDRAVSLLVHSRLTLKEVASLCGFQNEYYFSTVFARSTGLPPGIYRNKNGVTRLSPQVGSVRK